jgi:CRP-like cAMP-binding protein
MNRKEPEQFILDHLQKRISLTREERDYFCSLLQVRKVLARQYILQQGDVCRYESFVYKGFLRSFYVDDMGVDHTLHFAMEDWWIADSASFLGQEPSMINIIAHEPCVLLQINKQSLDELYRKFPVFERFWRILTQNFIVAQDKRILNTIALSGAERYQALIERYPTIENRLAQKHIASYLGISPVFLSQIRKKRHR